jgi:hypothetical protein
MPGENSNDPRDVLMRRKYFSLRPKPLERWLWAQRVPPAAERVFWLHWQEGLQRRDWCSEIPLRRVARECCLDPSTVTKSYQLLARLGCLRRTDPGRDPANPFQQAVAVTEVRVPRELLVELDRHPNRRTHIAPEPGKCVQAGGMEIPAGRPAVATPAPAAKPKGPFEGLSGRERMRAIVGLEAAMSSGELARYRDAHRNCRERIEFDADTRLSAEDQGRVRRLLEIVAAAPGQAAAIAPSAPEARILQSRTLSVFEVARLKRDIQAARGVSEASELLRQVTWSIETGPLKRFATTHAMHIALKKIREGAWTRPNRMPPNWAHPISKSSALEACRQA